MQVSKHAGSYTTPGGEAGNHWIEPLRVADLSVGTYSVRRGGADDQTPHTEDEIYVVTAGQATLEAGGQRARVGPGAVIYVAAGGGDRFPGITPPPAPPV